jgi:hypothetical protein
VIALQRRGRNDLGPVGRSATEVRPFHLAAVYETAAQREACSPS